MANVKISALPELLSADAADVLPIVDVSVVETKKVQVQNLPISTATQSALNNKYDASNPANYTNFALAAGLAISLG